MTLHGNQPVSPASPAAGSAMAAGDDLARHSPVQDDPAHDTPAGDGADLHRWFAVFLAWMVALAAVVIVGQRYAEQGRRIGLVLMLLGCYAFYLSLCCTFFPAPTTWIVMAAASNSLALIGPVWPRVVVIALIGAVATSMANLNEYHVFTFFLRRGRAARVRETRVYRWAARWFGVSPFAILVIVAIAPIPVDVVRWLAIAYRYSRSRFFIAYVIGRFVRYAVWAVGAAGLDLSFMQIMIIQTSLVGLAAAKFAVSFARARRKKAVSPTAPAPSAPPLEEPPSEA